MKIDIARQPLVPAFMTLFALAVAAMCAGIPVSDTSGAVRDALPLLGGQLARFQAAYPVWSKFAAGFMLLFTGMCAGRITIRYNLYTVAPASDSPLCHRRLRDRNRRELSRRIRSVDAARTGNEKLLPRLLQRVRVRRPSSVPRSTWG